MKNEVIVAIKVRTSRYSTKWDDDCLDHCVIKMINVKLINMPPNFLRDKTPEWFKDEYEYDVAEVILEDPVSSRNRRNRQCLCLNTDEWDVQTSTSVKPDVTIDVSKPGKGQ